MMKSWMIGTVIAAISLVGCEAKKPPMPTTAAAAIGTLRIDETFGQNRLRIYGYGGALEIPKLHAVYGLGMSVSLTSKDNTVLYEADWSEATCGGIVDYSDAGGGVYRFTDCTTDYRSKDDYVGLIETTVKVGGGTPEISKRVLLQDEKADRDVAKTLVAKAVRALETRDDDRENVLGDVLEHLRNMGVNDPGMALEAMKKLSTHTDAHFSEMTSDFIDEIELIMQVSAQKKNAGSQKPAKTTIQENPMRKVHVKPLTAEAFAKYGTFAMMVNPKAPKLGKEPVEFYRDMVPLVTGGASPMFSVCRVTSRPAVIDVSEYHTRCGEGMLALDGDVLMHFGIATADGQPPLDEIEVFRVPKGTFLAIRPGVWHHAPFTIGAAEANVLIVLPERTYANDCVVIELPPDKRLQIE